MSTARRQAAKAYKAEIKAQNEISSNEKRLVRIQRNTDLALVAISEYCTRRDGKAELGVKYYTSRLCTQLWYI